MIYFLSLSNLTLNSVKYISDDELQKLDSHYLSVAEQLLADVTLTVDGSRQQIIAEDLAIALMIGKFFTEDMNADGSMPTKRWRKMWTAMKDAGDIERQYSGPRFKTIRNFLTGLGLIDWEDEKYQVGWVDDEGKYHKGKAAKWKFSAELMATFEDADRGGASFRITDIDKPTTIELSTVTQPVWTPLEPSWIVTDDDLRRVNETITSFEQQMALAA